MSNLTAQILEYIKAHTWAQTASHFGISMSTISKAVKTAKDILRTTKMDVFNSVSRAKVLTELTNQINEIIKNVELKDGEFQNKRLNEMNNALLTIRELLELHLHINQEQ